MRFIKRFESFEKVKNITPEDIIECIEKKGKIFATIIKDLPNNDPDKPLIPLSVDDDGLVTLDYDGEVYETGLENIDRISLD